MAVFVAAESYKILVADDGTAQWLLLIGNLIFAAAMTLLVVDMRRWHRTEAAESTRYRLWSAQAGVVGRWGIGLIAASFVFVGLCFAFMLNAADIFMPVWVVSFLSGLAMASYPLVSVFFNLFRR